MLKGNYFNPKEAGKVDFMTKIKSRKIARSIFRLCLSNKIGQKNDTLIRPNNACKTLSILLKY